jgi:hypothetical protein
MLRPNILMSAILCICFQASPTGNRAVAKISDLSERGSPIGATGEVAFQEQIAGNAVTTQYQAKLEIENKSKESIVAYQISLDLLPPTGIGTHIDYRRDYLFEENLIMPNSRETLEKEGNSRLVSDSHSDSRQNARAELRVIFVEFADGSHFGSSDWGTNLRLSRQATIDRLAGLLHSYQQGKDAAFQTSLSDAIITSRNDDYLMATLSGIDETLKSKGIGVAVEEVRNKLSHAKNHQQAFGSLSGSVPQAR